MKLIRNPRLPSLLKWVSQTYFKPSISATQNPRPLSTQTEVSNVKRTQFVLDLGYKENTEEMELALGKFRGKGTELQERFNLLVRLGLDEKDVKDMVKACPPILSQSSDVLEAKVKYLVHELAYPLVTFPSCLMFSLARIKRRFNRNGIRITCAIRKTAEEVMLDYFYSTRGLQYMVAEHMSKNSPMFIDSLLKNVDCDAAAASEIRQSITSHLRFHPVNEFEPFLESCGLDPVEYAHLLPRDKLFLKDDGLLLENYQVLCYCGIDPKQIGKIFKEAREVFGYETGVLASKIKAYEELGFSRLDLSKLIVCIPTILVGEVDVHLAKVLEMLKSLGCDFDWVMKNLSEEGSYDWSLVYRVLSFLREICLDKDELRALIRKHPRLILEDSGDWTLILAGFGTKLGLSRKELCSLFQNFPQIQVEKCVSNLRHCFLFLKEIEMEDDEIRKIFRSHSWWLGSCSLKKPLSMLNDLKTWKRRLCHVIQENPEEMKKWTLGSKIQPLPATERRIRITPMFRKRAEEVMLDYFYSTSGLQYMIADHMSKNSPRFIDNLLKKVDCDVASEINKSITRYLQFHPVNEFEPFLESSGLKPEEYSHMVPCDKMFLKDDGLLLENLHVLCYCGVDLRKIGKILKEAKEVFGYEVGVLASKIQAYEELGFSRLNISKLIVCSPSILIGDVIVDLARVFEMLKSMGFDFDWVMKNLSEEGSYDWSSMYRWLCYLRDLCGNENELCELIRRRPGMIFYDSGEWTLILAGFETKLGLSRSELRSLFRSFQEIQVEICVSNLRTCFLFLRDIKMEADEIGKIFRCHSWWLGSCRLKKTSSLLVNLKTSKSRLRQVVRENPEEMKKWTMWSKIQPLPAMEIVTESEKRKSQFLTDLGYKENSKEMEIAIKKFCGRGSELRERFDFLVSLGLSEKDVTNMVKASPGILSQASDVLEPKVNYLVNELGCPLSALVAFPSCLKFTLERMKLRFAMYSWLRARGKAKPSLAVSTILACSDKDFAKVYVNRHPDGAKHFEDLKKQLL